MNQAELGSALRRRWDVVLVGLVATVGLLLGASRLVPVKYSASAEVLMLPPITTESLGANPYLALGGLDSFADVVARRLTDSNSSTELRSLGVLGAFTVIRDFRTNGPLLLITVTEHTAAAALSSIQKIVAGVAPALWNLQQAINVQSKYFITSMVVSIDQKAALVRKSQIRAMLVAVAAGLALTLFVTTMLDAFIIRRQQQRVSRSATHRRFGSRKTRGVAAEHPPPIIEEAAHPPDQRGDGGAETIHAGSARRTRVKIRTRRKSERVSVESGDATGP